MGEEGEEMSEEDNEPRFVLFLDVEGRGNGGKFDSDVMQFCSINARSHPSQEYLDALSKIAAMDKEMKADKPGVDIEVPVRVCFSMRTQTFTKTQMKALDDVVKAEKVIKEDWENYVTSPGNETVAPKTLRCRFVLEPMVADLETMSVNAESAETLHSLVRDNVRFSRMALAVGKDPERETDDHLWTTSFGQLLRGFFIGTRLRPEATNTKYYPDAKISNPPSECHQIESIQLWCDGWQQVPEIALLCSSLAVNKTTRRLALELCINQDDADMNALAWKWIAYAFFSKRARACSTLESLTLYSNVYKCKLSVADVEAFKRIALSEHPEEDLFGSPRGKVAERDGTLKAEAPIRWQFGADGRPDLTSRLLAVKSPIAFVRTFSDDGTSEWVNTIVPGFGRCQVQRCDLKFDASTSVSGHSSDLASLHLLFHQASSSNIDGLPQLMAVIGPSLRFLALGDVEMDKDENLYLGNCLNLEEMSLRSRLFEARLDFKDYYANNQPLPSLRLNREDMAILAADLRNTDTSMINCVRRLRVRLNNVLEMNGTAAAENTVDSLIKMLGANNYLEYLDVIAPPMYYDCMDGFDKYHHNPLPKGGTLLPTKSKTTFLSLLSSQQKDLEPCDKRRANGKSEVSDS